MKRIYPNLREKLIKLNSNFDLEDIYNLHLHWCRFFNALIIKMCYNYFMDKQQNKNGLNFEPSELIGKHFSQTDEVKKTPKAVEPVEQSKDPYEDLADRLTDKLDSKLFEPVDFRDEQEKRKKPINLKSIEQKSLEQKYKKELEEEKERERVGGRKKAQDIIGFIKGDRKSNEEQKKIKEEKDRLKVLERVRKKQAKEEQKELVKQRWPQLNFGDYINTIKKPVLYLVGLEFLIYFLSLINLFKSFLLDIILPLIIFVDIGVFIWLSIKISKEYNVRLITIKACLLTGILVGLFRAIFKVIWINELWTVFNLIIEPILFGAIAGVVGLVVSLLVKHANIDAN